MSNLPRGLSPPNVLVIAAALGAVASRRSPPKLLQGLGSRDDLSVDVLVCAELAGELRLVLAT